MSSIDDTSFGVDFSREGSATKQNDYTRSLVAESNSYADKDALKDGQMDQNSGWFQVKKKSRSSGKSSIGKPFIEKKLPGPYRKTKSFAETNGRENCKNLIPSPQQKEVLIPSSHQKEVSVSQSGRALTDPEDTSSKIFSAEKTHNETEESVPEQKDPSTNDTSCLNTKIPCTVSTTDEVVQHMSDSNNLITCPMVATTFDPPKFKWGNLDEDDLNQSSLMEIQGKAFKDHLLMPGETVVLKTEGSTIYLEGGKQSSTKALNGLKSKDSENMLADFSHTRNASFDTPECPDASHACEHRGHTKGYSGEETSSRSEVSGSSSSVFTPAVMENEMSLSKGVSMSGGLPGAGQPNSEVLFGKNDNNCTVSHDLIDQIISVRSMGPNIVDSVREDSDDKQSVEDILSCQGYEVGRVSTKKPIEFSVAASLLMEKFEETDSGESKERFRQRLWCYLFENLNRAIDELYFLCELECDMEQIQEALLVLKEAGMDFAELKSRVEGFEKIKKQPCLPQSLFGEGANGPYAKVEHRRPHAIAWEVRRMACSPHRAEILSSSLEAFKKVQQITAEKNLSSQSKRREASKLLDIQQTAVDPMTKRKSTSNISTNIKEPSTKVEEKPKSFTKVNFTCTPNRKESQLEIRGANKEPNEADLIEEASVCKASTCEKPHDTTTQDQTSFSGEVKDKESGFPSSKYDSSHTILASDERTNKSTEKRVCIIDGQKDKRVPKTRSSLDAWKVKRNWEDVLSSPMKNLNRPSRSPCAGWRSAERVRVLHDKLMSPERKRKSPLEMKKEVDEKQARATRIRRELENERVQRLQKTTEKLNRVSEWQAVRSNKLREGMHARQQRGESRHEAHLAEIARRAGDESSKVSEVRFITSLNEENKKLSLRQKLQDSELRRAERLQIIKIKQKEDVAREEAVLERRKIIEAERLQRLAEAQRKKEEAKARRDEERKAASAAREARAVEQVRKKEVRAKAQQEVTELQAQKLMEKLRESELRRKCYLEQIRERAAMESREQCSPSTRLPTTKDIQPKITDGDSLTEKEISRQSCSNKSAPKMALQHQALKRKVKKIRQKLMAKKYDFMEPPVGAEGFGIGSIAIAAAAKSKIGRWLQDLQRFQLARKAGTSGVSFIVAEMIKYFDGKVAELHAARQAGLIDFIATAIPASHTSKAETSQTTLSLLRILKVLLALPANRSYFISRNLLPPLIPILSTALENFSSQDAVIITSNSANASSSNGVTEKLLSDEKVDAAGEVLNGLLECVILVINHRSIDERQASMQDDLIELLTACEVIHHLRDLFSLFDRPQNEGAPFPAPVLYGLNLLQALTASRDKALSLSCELQLSAILNRKEAQRTLGIDNKASVCSNILAITTEKQSECQVKSDNLALAENEMKTDVLPVEHLGKNSELTAEVPHTDLMQLESTKMEDCDATGIFTKGESDTKHRQESTQENSTGYGLELAYEKGQTRQQLLSGCHSINVLVSAIAETGLVGLPSLLTAVLLQTNPRSTPEQAASILPSNFEEIATVVLKVLNNLARLDLALVQSLLAMPDLQMEFFHLVSFLLSHCTCKWANPSDQVASLLLETLLLLGYFALLHPGNQAVLRWGKSPTILHKICDLPFAFFSDPSLMPALVGTLLSVCYGSEQNRDVVREELSMEMLLSLLKSSRTENLADKDIVVSEASSVPHSDETDSAPRTSSSDTINEEKTLSQNVCDDDIIPAKEEIKRMIEDIVTSDGETGAGARQQPSVRSSCGKFSTIDSISSPNKRSNKAISKVPVTSEVELPLSKDLVGIKSRTACRGSTSSSTAENPSSQSRKVKANGPESLVRNGNANTVPVSNKRQPSVGPSENQLPLMDCPYASADASELDLCHRPDLMLQNRFPACLLDMAQDFFAAGL